MADSSPYILAAPDGTLPNSRTLHVSGGLVLQDTGGEGTTTITTVGNLDTLNTFNAPGFLVYDTVTNNIAPRSLIAGTGIVIEAPAGQGADTTITVVSDSTTQQVNVLNNAVPSSQPRTNLNFIPSGSVSITIGDNSLENRTDINISGVVAASTDSTYITKTPDAGLPNSQPLSPLDTGLLKVTTGTGVLSIAVSDTDYQSASPILTSISGVTPTIGTLLVGNGTGFDEFLPSSTAGEILTSNGTGAFPSWEAPATGNLTDILPNPAVETIVLQGKTTYIATSTSGAQNFSLPLVVDAVPGDFYEIVGAGNAGWTVAQNASQQISIGNMQTTVGVGGSLQTTSVGGSFFSSDSIIIYCVTPTSFVAQIASGFIGVN